MKKVIIILIVAFFLQSCTKEIAIEPPAPNVLKASIKKNGDYITPATDPKHQ